MRKKKAEYDWVETLQSRLMLDVVQLASVLDAEEGGREGDILIAGKSLHVAIKWSLRDTSIGQWVAVVEKPKKKRRAKSKETR